MVYSIYKAIWSKDRTQKPDIGSHPSGINYDIIVTILGLLHKKTLNQNE